MLAPIYIKDKDDRKKEIIYCGKSVEKYLNIILNMWDAWLPKDNKLILHWYLGAI